ncbi:chorismate binding enzyme [Bradyrhizobium shewense]|uniref:Chorismate binding enzyme n=1 Tax=Bradyrhizobium shewense TaxID=1761772 RepID=A0A1C3XTH5_9BRAD|nr:chorismate binding enzyme [Bradyrhizobium shewense]
METICEIEHVARKIYCGLIGFIGFHEFAIRTVTIRDEMAVFHAA